MTTRGEFILISSTSLTPINSCLEHEEKVSCTYKCLILNRRSPLKSHSIDGYVLLGWHWISQYHYVAFIHRNAIVLQFCNKGRVFCIFKEFPHFPIFLIACEDIMLFLAAFAVAAYFSEIYGNGNEVSLSRKIHLTSAAYIVTTSLGIQNVFSVL